jgi:hypothetical protein
LADIGNYPGDPLEPGQLIVWVAARVAPRKRIRAVRLVVRTGH